MEISKKSLGTVFENQIKLDKVKDSIVVNIKSKTEDVKIQNLKQSKKQSWTSYMGYLANSAFN